MKRHWFVVANSARARVIERTGSADDWADVADLAHPESRWPAGAPGPDRRGHVEGRGHGVGGATFRPRTEPRAHERERFAREIAALLDAGIAERRFDDLVLVASDPFLGVLDAHLGSAALGRVRARVAHDWTGLPDDELVVKLRAVTRPA